MKKMIIFLMVCMANYALAQDLVIIHTNDMYSNLNGSAPEMEYTPLVRDNDPTFGGFSRIAGYINNQRQENKGKVLVVDAGDFLMGTLYQSLETETGFQLNLMKKMGYDYVAIGNHEFDFGPNTLARIIENNQHLGEIPQMLNANYVPAKDDADSSLVKKFADGTILPYSVVQKNGFKIGLFGVLGKDADEAIASYIDAGFGNVKKVTSKTAKYLKAVEKVDLVVVLSHSGVTKTKKGDWQGEDYELAKAVPEVDVVISGHTHTELPVMVRAGNGIVVQTGSMGKKVGRLAITFNKNHKPVFDYQLVAMDDNIPGDEAIQKLIDEKAAYINQYLLSDIGAQMQKPLLETSFSLTMDIKKPESGNLGPFVSDAIYYMLNTSYNEKVDVAIVASGVIRNNIEKGKNGLQNINDLFNVMPLGVGEGKMPGSPLGKIYVTGNELKKVMELIFAVYHSKEDYYLYSTGMNICYNPEKGLFKKITEISIGTEKTGYRKVSFSKNDKTLYALAANKYILSFIGTLKKMSFGLVNVVAKNADGSKIENDNFLIDTDKSTEGIQEAKEWLALLGYVRSFPDTNGNGIPDMPDLYRTKQNPFTIIE